MEEKHPQTIAAVGEYEFPEEIIQQIQSFMGKRKAAGTTLVSKSWYRAWRTRPKLSFHEHELRERFRHYATKTLQRYENLNLKIQTFIVRMRDADPDLAREWILKAMKLGATDLTIHVPTESFVLPDEVFESQTLATLSVGFVRLDLERMNKPLTSSNLKSLTLKLTNPKSLTLKLALTKGDFSYLSRSFPLLEELTLEGNCFPDQPFLSFYGCTTKLKKLEFLQLRCLNIEDRSKSEFWLQFSEFWLQFPCLKTLVIWDCDFICLCDLEGKEVIRICIPSLECLTISSLQFTKAKLEFDVPNIRKFKFEGYDVPRLELKTSSREWESDIRITCLCSIASASWLCSLKQFVKLLSPSRVSLDVIVLSLSRVSLDKIVLGAIQPRGRGDQNGDGLAIHVVENLTISGDPLSPAFLNALFWSCRPNFVNIERRCVRGIEKENVEQFQHLNCLPWNTLLDDSTNHSEEEFVRFQHKCGTVSLRSRFFRFLRMSCFSLLGVVCIYYVLELGT